MKQAKVTNVSYREQIMLVIFTRCKAQDMREQLAYFGEGQERLWNNTLIHAWVARYDVSAKQAGDYTCMTRLEMGGGLRSLEVIIIINNYISWQAKEKEH